MPEGSDLVRFSALAASWELTHTEVTKVTEVDFKR